MKKRRNTAFFWRIWHATLYALGVFFALNFSYADEFYGGNAEIMCGFDGNNAKFVAEFCKNCDENLESATCSLSIENNECVYTAQCLPGYDANTLDNSDPTTPICSPIGFAITYNLNGGSWKSDYTPITAYTIEEEDIILPTAENIARNGYVFSEWTTTSGNPITQIPHDSKVDIEVTAQWDVVNYSITYNNMDDATNFADAPTNYTVESETIILGTPVKPGYVFDGWVDGSGVPVTQITQGLVGDIELYAQWTMCQSGTNGVDTYWDNGQCSLCPVNYRHSLSGATDISQCYAIVKFHNEDTEEYIAYVPGENDDGYTLPDLPCNGTSNCEIPGHDGYPLEILNYYITSDLTGGTIKPDTLITGDIELYSEWANVEYSCDSRFSVAFDNVGTKACLSKQKPDSASSPLVMVFQIDGEKYYLAMTPDAESLPISSTTNTKMKVLYNNQEYNVHDVSVSIE